MTAPSTHLRLLHEAAARRRLEIAKLLRDDPTITNKQLAKALNVSRNTITLDRRLIMEQLKQSTLTETELMRGEMVLRLEELTAEVEKHRKDGRLSLAAIDSMLSISKAIIELTGCRKPVVEKMDIRKRTVSFTTSIVGPPRLIDGVPVATATEPKTFELKEPLTLQAGDHE